MKGKMHAIDATSDTEPDFVQTNHPQSCSLSIFSSLSISSLSSFPLSDRFISLPISSFSLHFLILYPFPHSLHISSRSIRRISTGCASLAKSQFQLRKQERGFLLFNRTLRREREFSHSILGFEMRMRIKI